MKTKKRILSLIVAIMIAFVTFTSGYATIDSNAATYKASKAWVKELYKVKKGKNTRIVNKNGAGYIKFKASSAGKYKFTFKDVCRNNNPRISTSGYIKMYRYKNGKATDIIFGDSVSKSRTSYIYIGNKAFCGSSGRYGSYVTTRVNTIRMKKNETVLIYTYLGYNVRTYYNIKVTKA